MLYRWIDSSIDWSIDRSIEGPMHRYMDGVSTLQTILRSAMIFDEICTCFLYPYVYPSIYRHFDPSSDRSVCPSMFRYMYRYRYKWRWRSRSRSVCIYIYITYASMTVFAAAKKAPAQTWFRYHPYRSSIIVLCTVALSPISTKINTVVVAGCGG